METSRRFRGIFGIATTWGVAFSTLATGSLAVGLAAGLVPSSVFGARDLVAVAVRGLLLGGVAGGVFAWLLAHRERAHSLATLSTRRTALWGFVAAGSIPAILALAAVGPALPLSVLAAGTAGFGGVGSLLSTGTLRLARRAQTQLDNTDEGLSRLTP